MTEFKGTPGPWESWPHNRARHPEHSHGVSAEGKKPCDVADVIAFDGQPEESEANARLIAAAPELLAACKAREAVESHFRTCDACRADLGGNVWHCNEHNRLSKLASEMGCAAIAKAEPPSS